jgi:hypothetical protein
LKKSSGGFMKQAAWLTVFCGGATTLFGFYTGSLFGMSIPDMLGYESIAASPFLDFQNQFFSLALALGVVQILFGMLLNICLQTKLFGFTSTFGLLGWFIILLSGCLAVGLPMLNESLVISWFTASSPAFYAAMGVGAVLMLLLNNIKRNPLINIGSGLWDAYNNITGLLSDVLSYIRLFAIGLSGGVLAQVFNSLAMGLTGLDAGIESFGVGGLPEAGGFYESVCKWMEKGRTVVLTTQVQNEGSDLTVYQVGQRLKTTLGVLEAYDMTTEAAVAKLMWILGQTRAFDEVERLFYAPVARDILYSAE